MFAFVARQPILDRNKEVFAYELFFRDGKNNCFPDSLYNPTQVARYSPEAMPLSLDDISSQKTSFINFTNDTLSSGLPAALDPKTVVVEIAGQQPVDVSLVDACKDIKNMGFQIAIDDPQNNEALSSLMDIVDIVKLDISKLDQNEARNKVHIMQDSDLKLVAEEVHSYAQFEAFRELGFDYFQGYFFSRPESLSAQNLPASKLSLVELIGETSNEEFNIERINSIIERDVGLSYMLLRFINNPLINKRFKITSLKHALNYMGEVEIKKFIALLALTKLNDNKPMELIHMSLVRAKFCDLLALMKDGNKHSPTGFMVGLFSLLDALLDQKMAQVVEKIPVLDEVKYALCGGQNQYHHFLMLARAFESGTWMNVARECKTLEINQKQAHSLFNEAIMWGNAVRSSISPHFPKTIAG